jgi:hypothetical protein
MASHVKRLVFLHQVQLFPKDPKAIMSQDMTRFSAKWTFEQITRLRNVRLLDLWLGRRRNPTKVYDTDCGAFGVEIVNNLGETVGSIGFQRGIANAEHKGPILNQ